MIYSRSSRIWTEYGYVFVEDLYVGQKVISFNPARGVCEYDYIQGIQTEYSRCMGLGLSAKSFRQVLTSDHPLLIWDLSKKVLTYTTIEERFMRHMFAFRPKAILAHAPFEPYKITQSTEDIMWSARYTASIAAQKRVSLDSEICLKDLGGYEAQLWLETFFHWNKLVPNGTWMATVVVNNEEVRRLLYNIAPRAGVGVKLHMLRNKSLMSISTDGRVLPHTGWFKATIDGMVFNLTTSNGNVLMKSYGGTSLVACDKGV